MVEGVHSIIAELIFVHEINSCMHDVGVHMPSFLGEASDAIAALFGGAELEFEDGLIAGVDYNEIVGHDDSDRKWSWQQLSKAHSLVEVNGQAICIDCGDIIGERGSWIVAVNEYWYENYPTSSGVLRRKQPLTQPLGAKISDDTKTDGG